MRGWLIFACLVLGAVAVAQWWVWPVQPPSTEVAPEPAESAADNAVARGFVPRFQLPPAEDFQEINQRPLFVDGRRLPQPEPEGTPKPAPESSPLPKHLGLTAVLVTEDGASALIVDRNEKKTLSLRQGDELAGWKIVGIQPDRVVLSQGGSSQEMLLRIFDPSPPPPPPLRTARSASKRSSSKGARADRSREVTSQDARADRSRGAASSRRKAGQNSSPKARLPEKTGAR